MNSVVFNKTTKNIKNFNTAQIRFYSYMLFIYKFNVFNVFVNNFSIYSKTICYNLIIDLNIAIKLYNCFSNKINFELPFSSFSCRVKFLLLNNTLHNFIYYKKYFNLINNYFLFSLIGSIIKLDVIGYVRRAWYRKKQNILYFRLGYSCFNKFVLDKKLILTLLKKRLLTFFSVHLFRLFSQASYIRNLLKTNFYKLSGILYNQELINLKKSKKQKVGGSY